MLLTAACTGGSRRPDILIVLIDTLRADHLGCYGSSKSLTPFIDELAGRGTLFRHAYATSSWTLPSVASLFTSRYPKQHQVVSMETKLGAEETTLAERLGAVGYSSAAFIGHFRLSPMLGLWQGFPTVFLNSQMELHADTLTRAAMKEVDAKCSGKREAPCLLYLHYFEPHAPYDPPPEIARRFLKESETAAAKLAQEKLVGMKYAELSDDDVRILAGLYEGEVTTIDAGLRDLFAKLESRGFLENTVVVLTADHGEEFREHGGFAHGTALYEETVRVPLIILAPGHAPKVVDENVSLVDVMPTLFDLAGLPEEASFEGRSLVPLMKPAALWDMEWLGRWLGPARKDAEVPKDGRSRPDVILQLEPSGGKLDFRRHSDGIVRGTKKLVVRRTGESDVFDLATDPKEQTPNPAGEGGVQKSLSAALAEIETKLRGRGVARPQRVELDEAAKEKLRALGYENFF